MAKEKTKAKPTKKANSSKKGTSGKIAKPWKIPPRRILLANGVKINFKDSGKTPWKEKVLRDRARERRKEQLAAVHATENKNIFDVRLVENEEGEPTQYEHRAMKGKEGSGRLALRKDLSTIVPEDVKLSLLLEARKLEEMDYVGMIPGIVHYFVDDFVGDERKLLAFAVNASPEMTHDAELWYGEGVWWNYRSFLLARRLGRRARGSSI